MKAQTPPNAMPADASAPRPPAFEAAAESAPAAWEPGVPSSRLGPAKAGRKWLLRAELHGALSAEVLALADGRVLGTLAWSPEEQLFIGTLPRLEPYRLKIRWPHDEEELVDAYQFGPQLGELDLYLLSEGTHLELARRFGSRPLVLDGVAGVHFSVWAPNARSVAVVGDFNGWDHRRAPLRKRRGTGVWELFLPGVTGGSHYRYEIEAADGQRFQKADPLACRAAPAPQTASVVGCGGSYAWSDQDWMARRGEVQRFDRPMSVYELHAGSWRRRGHEHNRALRWPELAAELIPYVVEQGFTHIELLPVMAHPFGGSWGYQPLGLFAPQPELGEPAEFAAFVDAAHRAGIGVILDWVPGHFPADEHGLAQFDGTALYEYADPREGRHRDWDTLIYNFGRHEVRSFLLSSALHWLEQFHLDGLRVDAVASMLYRDYSRPQGEWLPNRLGGRENLEAIDFLRQLNRVVRERLPDVRMIAEESTIWPKVSRPEAEGGLGFHYKWNMGWMNDSLAYMRQDPLHRGAAHQQLSYVFSYAFSEHYVLPLSHDEVVHGKKSLLQKMPGDRWQQFANLRAYYGFMWAHPGKKLLFMGGELGQHAEWNHDGSVDWPALGDPLHAGLQQLVRDLNGLYRAQPGLHECDVDSRGFYWLIGDDHQNSVYAFVRSRADGSRPVLAVCNFTPVPRKQYRIGVPKAGTWRELFNSDAQTYGGSGHGNFGQTRTLKTPSHGQPCSLRLTLPPLSTLYLVWDDTSEEHVHG